MFFQRAMSFKVHGRELSVVFSGICANSLVTPSPNVLLSLSHLTCPQFLQDDTASAQPGKAASFTSFTNHFSLYLAIYLFSLKALLLRHPSEN